MTFSPTNHSIVVNSSSRSAGGTMWKHGIIFTVFHILISDTNAQAEKPNCNWMVQLGMRENARQIVNKQLPYEELAVMGCNHSHQDETMQSTNYQRVRRSAFPLVELGGQFYYFGTYFKANFFKALHFCKDHGMELVAIESEEENSGIIKYIKEKLGKVEHFWTSGSDIAEEGHFVWHATGKPLNFTFWVAPEPNNVSNIEDCIEIWHFENKTYIWNDRDCTSEYNFICEVKKCNDFCLS